MAGATEMAAGSNGAVRGGRGAVPVRRSGRTPRPHRDGSAKPRHWAQALRENPLTRYIPFSSLVGAHDVVTRGGDWLRVWRLDGVPFECADPHLITERHEAFCSLLRNLAGGQWAVWTHRLHRVVGDRLQRSSWSPVSHGTCRSCLPGPAWPSGG